MHSPNARLALAAALVLAACPVHADDVARYKCTFNLSYKRNIADSTPSYTSKNLLDNIEVDFTHLKLPYNLKAMDAKISKDEISAAAGAKSTISIRRSTLAYTSAETDALRQGDLYLKSGTCVVDASKPLTVSNLPDIKSTYEKNYDQFEKDYKGRRFLDKMRATIVRDRSGPKDYSIELGGAVECSASNRIAVDPSIKPKEGDLVKVSGNIHRVVMGGLLLEDCTIGPP